MLSGGLVKVSQLDFSKPLSTSNCNCSESECQCVSKTKRKKKIFFEKKRRNKVKNQRLSLCLKERLHPIQGFSFGQFPICGLSAARGLCAQK